ncbi:hypothetical protein [Providencia huaxiensis]|uniref:hypothetical protein n=1 Tax=Providencia huaxiensis TaxID=2027290 RepID=UPI0034E448E4
MKKILTLLVLSFPIIACSDNTPYDLPTDGSLANAIKPELVGAPKIINDSIRITYLEATDNSISALITVGAIDTTKHKNESNMLDSNTISNTRQSIINKYCAPFGMDNIYFDQFRQRKVELIYHFQAGSLVPLFSFTVNADSCST